VEFREGLDSGAIIETRIAYGMSGVGAVTQGNVIYVNPNFWDIFTNPSNTEFWHEVGHTQQSSYTFYIEYGLSSLLAAAGGGDAYRDNSFERGAEAYGQVMADRFRRENRCR
jgi:hypothetical protein